MQSGTAELNRVELNRLSSRLTADQGQESVGGDRRGHHGRAETWMIPVQGGEWRVEGDLFCLTSNVVLDAFDP